MARCDTYAEGNCTWGCCELASWIPEDLGDAGDWAANAPSHGLVVVSYPVPGSVVSYCRGDGYSFWGHCAYVDQVFPDGTFLVTEMNYTTFNAYDQRVSSQYDVCGFILPPGGVGGPGGGPGQGAGGPGIADAVDAWGAWQWYLSGGWTRDSDNAVQVFQNLNWLRRQ